MAKTSLPTDQITIFSSTTGEHNLDTYIEALEKGGRSLPDILDDLFDETGTLIADIEMRHNAGELEYRYGIFVDPEDGWVSIATFNKWQGDYTAGNDYNAGDVVEYNNGVIYFVDAYTNVPVTPDPDNDAKLIWLIDATYINNLFTDMETIKSDTQTIKDNAVTETQGIAAQAVIDTQALKDQAATSATNAATSETNAAASELVASTSASNAATSEANSLVSEQNASASAISASNDRTVVEDLYNDLNNQLTIGKSFDFFSNSFTTPNFYYTGGHYPFFYSQGDTMYQVVSQGGYKLRRFNVKTLVEEVLSINMDITQTAISGFAYDKAGDRLYVVTYQYAPSQPVPSTIHRLDSSLLNITTDVNISDYIISSQAFDDLPAETSPMTQGVAYDPIRNKVIVIQGYDSYRFVDADTLAIGIPVSQSTWGQITLGFPSSICITPDGEYYIGRDSTIRQIDSNNFGISTKIYSTKPAGTFGSGLVSLVHYIFGRVFSLGSYFGYLAEKKISLKD